MCSQNAFFSNCIVAFTFKLNMQPINDNFANSFSIFSLLGSNFISCICLFLLDNRVLVVWSLVYLLFCRKWKMEERKVPNSFSLLNTDFDSVIEYWILMMRLRLLRICELWLNIFVLFYFVIEYQVMVWDCDYNFYRFSELWLNVVSNDFLSVEL